MSAEPKEFTVIGLARALGVNRKTIYEWQKKFAGKCPTTLDPELWKVFVDQEGLLVDANNRSPSEREELLKEKLRKEIMILDLKIAEGQRKSVDRAEVNQFLLHVALMQKSVFTQATREGGPRCEGKSAAEIGIYLKSLVHRVCDIMQQETEKWVSN